MTRRFRLTQSLTLLVLLLATAVLGYLLCAHTYLNQTRYHPWSWHRTPAFPLYPLLALAGAPVILVQILTERRGLPPRGYLPLLCISCIALQFLAATLQWNELSLTPIVRNVRSPIATSFFNDAQDFLAEGSSLHQILSSYPQRMANLHYHSRNKPPMPVLFYYAVLHIFPDPDSAALAGACIIALIAATAVPLTWQLTKILTGDAAAAFNSACAITLIPGLAVFLPEFDQIYVPMVALLIILWALALQTRRSICSISFGVLFSLLCLFTYTTLVIGAFLLGYTLLHFLRTREWRTIVIHFTIALATIIFFHLALYLFTGYRPIATFLAAYHNQTINLAPLRRPWPYTIPSDLTEFLRAAGWIAAIPILAWLLTLPPEHRRYLPLVLLCLFQPLVTALGGQLQSETARLWLFMQPLFMIPVGLELSRWPLHHRLTFYSCQLLHLGMLTQYLRFH